MFHPLDTGNTEYNSQETTRGTGLSVDLADLLQIGFIHLHIERQTEGIRVHRPWYRSPVAW